MLPAGSHPRPRAAFSRASTAAYAGLWLFLVAVGWSPLVELDPIWWLQHPATSAERVTSRDLELGEAIEASSSPTREVLELLYDTRAVGLERSVEIQRGLVETAEQEGLLLEGPSGLPGARARLAVLLLESGLQEEAWAWLEDEPRGFASALTTAYAGAATATPGGGTDELDELMRSAGLDGWYLDRVRIAHARAEGDAARASRIQAALVARGARWRLRTVGVFAVNVALVLVGGAILARHLRSIRAVLEAPAGGAPWSLEDGLGVFIRGDFWNRAYFVGITSLGELPGLGAQVADSAAGDLLFSWATLVAALPLLWLVHRHLLVPGGGSAAAVFGLLPRGTALARAGGIGLVAVAVDLAGTYALGWGAFSLGIESSWTEGFDETLVWGSTGRAVMTAVDYVVWAPAFEELAFRGVLYFSLRHRFGAGGAALLTATFFAGMHFYSLPGFLMTLWSGFVWALAFERSRSLLPGIGAHAVYNLLYVAGLVLLYR